MPVMLQQSLRHVSTCKSRLTKNQTTKRSPLGYASTKRKKYLHHNTSISAIPTSSRAAPLKAGILQARQHSSIYILCGNSFHHVSPSFVPRPPLLLCQLIIKVMRTPAKQEKKQNAVATFVTQEVKEKRGKEMNEKNDEHTKEDTRNVTRQ